MATKKTHSPRKARAKRAAPRTVKGPEGAGNTLRDTWGAALSALNSAEAEVQRQLGDLMKRNKLTPQNASAVLQDLQARFERERKKAVRQLDDSLAEMQGRVKKERKNLGTVVNDAVHAALVAFNIPSRKEVAELTRKVDELSRKIDGFRKAPRASAVRTRKAVPRRRASRTNA